MNTETKPKKEPTVHSAPQRVTAVLSVWTERRRPSEVCQEMGINAALLGQWEKRFLQMGVLSQEEQEPRRRSPPPDPETEALREENRQLRRRIELLEQSLQIRRVMEAPEKKKRPIRTSHETDRAIQTGSGAH